jgi:hypothetical protein
MIPAIAGQGERAADAAMWDEGDDFPAQALSPKLETVHNENIEMPFRGPSPEEPVLWMIQPK